MSYYYLMNTLQKDTLTEDLLEGQPKSNLSGSEWIIEASASDLECIQAFPSAQECINYIVINNSDWDEFYNI